MRVAHVLPTLILAGACQTPQQPPPSLSGAQESVECLAATLVDLAARRVDLSTIRATILPFRRAAPAEEPAATPVAQKPAQADLVGAELQREFELALANRLHVVEPDVVERVDGQRRGNAAEPASAPSAAPRAVSHALVGDYALRDGKLVLSVRLVDLESQLVLSAAREALPLSWFSPEARAQLAPPAPASRNRVVVAHSVAGGPSGADPVIVQPSSPAALEPAAEPSEPATPALARSPLAPTRSAPIPEVAPVEDFETWRARRQAQQLGHPATEAAHPRPAEPAPQGTPPPGSTEAKPGSSPAGASMLPYPSEPREPFPWRQDNRLAQLLGIPRPGPRDKR